MGRLTRQPAHPVLGIVLAAALLSGLAPAALAGSPGTFGTPTGDSTFGTGIVFSQPVTVAEPIARAEILLTIADAIGPTVVEVPAAPAVGASTLTYTLDTSGGAHMIPNTGIVARWRLFAAGDLTLGILGPELRIVYEDDRFQWKTAGNGIIRIHWFEGDAAFAAKALKLGEDEVRATSTLLGVTETEPIDFFVYPDVDSFYGVIGPGAHENVAGQAFAEIRTMLGLIPPDQIDDPIVAARIPHEFVHLVFNTASKNPYHRPPRWLNEGLAVYQSESYGSQDRAAVRSAAAAGNLIPLDGLTGQFPNGNDFFLAYSESVAAVDYMIRTYTQDALVKLIRSYADGRTDDEAFKDALGVDMTAFGAAWFKSVNATPKQRFGPQPAPPGPVPSAWVGTAAGGGSPAPASGAPGASATAVPGPVGGPASSNGTGWLWLVVVVALVVIVGGVTLFIRRRQPPVGLP